MSEGYRLEFAREKLLYRNAFGTAHGMRDGTEAVFLRLHGHGVVGYGEATLPPYVHEAPENVIETISSIEHQEVIHSYINSNKGVSESCEWPERPAARAAFTMALMDLKAKVQGISVAKLLGATVAHPGKVATSVTIGLGPLDDISQKINGLPSSDLIKLKLGGTNDLAVLEAVQAVDKRPLLLDANQAWVAVDQALNVLQHVEPGRLAGLEQPFAAARWDLHAQLQAKLDVPIYGDESIQGIADLDKALGSFRGVNVKLMKCGGLDRALAMVVRAQELGLHVMLGCMSESSLGCAAMAQLQAYADVADLDGPWLLKNDPFGGLSLKPGGLHTKGAMGCGVELTRPLNWIQFGT